MNTSVKQKICQQFIKSPGINPMTNRKIKIGGPVYKKLLKECENFKSNLDDHNTYNKNNNHNKTPHIKSQNKVQKCNEFIKTPSKNPYTGRKIKQGGDVYKKIQRDCANVINKQPAQWITINRSKPVKRRSVNPNNRSSLVELCNAFVKSPTINPKTNRKIKIGGPTYNELVKQCEVLKPELRRSPVRSPGKISLVKRSPNKGSPTKRSRGISNRQIVTSRRVSPYRFSVISISSNDTNISNRSISINQNNLSSRGFLNLCNAWFAMRKQRLVDRERFYKKYPNIKIFEKCKPLESRLINEKSAQNNIKKQELANKRKGYIEVRGYRVHKTPKDVPQEFDGYLLKEVLGQGSFGITYSCIELSTGKEYAIKLEKKTNFEGLSNEDLIYKKLKDNPYIPKFLKNGELGNYNYIIMERLYPIPEFNLLQMKNIIKAIKSFADNNISHCDIKFDNTMQKENGDIVIIDFGLSRQISKTKYDFVPGTPGFMSINAHRGVISYKNDIESFCWCLLDTLNVGRWFMADKNLVEYKIQERNKILNKDVTTIQYYKLDKYPDVYLFIEHVFNLDTFEYPNFNLLLKFFV
ncbi:major virion DNA-binding protein [Dasineura jujubifolia toursvirus 2a]|nr:major virion DNA-binding protein [Dasineura jujubifolia toursvirus 2a]